MLNSLDMLVIVFAALVTLALLSVIMMFAPKNIFVKKVFFYITAAIALYSTYSGLRMFWPMYMGKALFSIIFGLAAIVSVVLASIYKDNKKLFLIVRIIASASVILSLLNNFAI